MLNVVKKALTALALVGALGASSAAMADWCSWHNCTVNRYYSYYGCTVYVHKHMCYNEDGFRHCRYTTYRYSRC